MIVKTILHGLLAAGLLAAGVYWGRTQGRRDLATEVSYAQSGYTATPNADGGDD